MLHHNYGMVLHYFSTMVKHKHDTINMQNFIFKMKTCCQIDGQHLDMWDLNCLLFKEKKQQVCTHVTSFRHNIVILQQLVVIVSQIQCLEY